MENESMRTSDIKSEFICDKECCVGHGRRIMSIGRSTATALTGFLAGAIVTALVLYPWLYVLGKLCPSRNY